MNLEEVVKIRKLSDAQISDVSGRFKPDELPWPKKKLCDVIRSEFLDFSKRILSFTPECGEQDMALDSLVESMDYFLDAIEFE